MQVKGTRTQHHRLTASKFVATRRVVCGGFLFHRSYGRGLVQHRRWVAANVRGCRAAEGYVRAPCKDHAGGDTSPPDALVANRSPDTT